MSENRSCLGRGVGPVFMLGCLVLVAGLSAVACRTGAEAVQSDFRAVVAKALPTVVKIDVLELAKDRAPDSDSKPFFDYFFDNPDGQKPDRSYQQESLGSGILVRQVGDQAYVVTNAHVIADAQDITLTLDDGREFSGRLVGRDERKDLALIAFDTAGAKLPVAELGDSDQLMVGDWVLAMGAPYGFQSSVTAGIVSALHRRGGPSGNINDFIQTDASINKGNSGGALVNIRGQVVGINTWITSQTGDSVGLGFSIPINNIKHAINDFIAVGHIRYGWLGVSVNSLDSDMSASLGITGTRGALVSSIYHGSPADIAGLCPGDLISGLGRRPILDADDLIQAVGELEANSSVTLSIIRGDKALQFKADITLRQEEAELAKHSVVLWPGMSLYPVTEKVRKDLELPGDLHGLVVRQVIPQTAASKAGLKSRDCIVRCNGQVVATLADFYQSLAETRRDEVLALDVLRDGKEMKFELKVIKEGQ